jgi:hypothetical protein
MSSADEGGCEEKLPPRDSSSDPANGAMLVPATRPASGTADDADDDDDGGIDRAENGDWYQPNNGTD